MVGVENGTAAVEDNRKVLCTDGDPCDQGPCGDDRCDMRVAACINQTDDSVADCTPPSAGLERVTIRGALVIEVQQVLTDPTCTPYVDAGIEARFNKAGKYLAKKSRVKLKGKARAAAGTKPRSDSDKWIIECAPRMTGCP